jgi:hypothetical protein
MARMIDDSTALVLSIIFFEPSSSRVAGGQLRKPKSGG